MKIKKLIFFIVLIVAITISNKVRAQLTGIAINDDGVKADTSAMLDVNVNVTSPKRGFLLPRMTTAQRDAIFQPAKALLIYCTNVDSLEMNIGTAAAPHWITFNFAGTAGWLTTGNSGTNTTTNFLGTTDNVGLSIRTNNTEHVYIDKKGYIGIGSNSFDPSNPELLLADYGNTTSHTVAYLKGKINDYFQINLQNNSNGSQASTDFVATADNGTDSTWYVDLGINSSNYAPGQEFWGGADDAYLYSYAKNLLIGTQQSYSDIIFMFGGGVTKTNTALRIVAPSGNLVVGTGEGTNGAIGNTLRGPNAGGTNKTGGSLTIQGGSSTGNATGGSVNINGGTSVTGTSGSVNINTSANFATNIGTGTTTSNVSIGNSSNNILFPKFTTVGGVFYTTAATGQIATTAAGVSGQFLMSNGAAAPTWSSGNGNFWQITGNSGTTAGTNFIGTTDIIDFVIKTNNTERMRITSAGLVGINTPSPTAGSSLDVKGHLALSNGGTASELRFYEPSASGTNYTGFKAQPQASDVTYTLPSADGGNGQLLSTNGSGTLSWSNAGNLSYAITPVMNDQSGALGGSYTFLTEVAVPVSAGDVLVTNANFSGLFTAVFSGIRVTRSTTSGSGSVGTIAGYSFTNAGGGSKYQATSVTTRESGIAAGTWYYKLWVLSSYTAGTENYNMVVTKTR